LLGNFLNGTIPTEIGELSNLVELYLGRNRFTGSIPTELGLLSNLEDVNVGAGNDQLTGSVPTELCDVISRNDLDFIVFCDRVSCSCGCDCSYQDDTYY
jgi:hypothetical protein